MFRHKIKILKNSKILKFEYLKDEKRFRDEVKTYFLGSKDKIAKIHWIYALKKFSNNIIL